MTNYTFIDLFAGCGGLSEGFYKQDFKSLTHVEYDSYACRTLKTRMLHYGYSDEEASVLETDITNDNIIDQIKNEIKDKKVDIIIGGPPCQSFSTLGRAKDDKGMADDPRNFLFESYVKILNHFEPKVFVFENVIGLLSAKPKDRHVVDLIREEFDKHGYVIISDLKKYALQDLTLFGVPQKRNRVIIIGIRKDLCNDTEAVLKDFYSNILSSYHEPLKTVEDAIGDLPKLFPVEEYRLDGKKYSHSQAEKTVLNHDPRFHNRTDIGTFGLLAQDIESGAKKFTSTDELLKLYTERTGKSSAVHKYYVLRRDDASNTIPAHLYKDGLRHIHPDSGQARSITVREAARLQTFDDDYEFISAAGANYKMIGNAVPPYFSYKLALAIDQLLFKIDG